MEEQVSRDELSVLETEMKREFGITQKIKDALLTFLAVCLAIELACYTYFGSLLFFQVSVHQILHTCVCGMSNICAGRVVEVIHVLLWCVSSVSVVAIVIDLDIRLLTSFFRNIFEFCNLSRLRQYIQTVWIGPREGSCIPVWLRRVFSVIAGLLLLVSVPIRHHGVY